MPDAGTLYVVATPIGNLGDISPRALDTLRRVDLIAAEDTRHSGQMLARLGISTRLTALHLHNETEAAPRLIEQLRAGHHIALISDAGTPAISDPGAVLVGLAHASGITVSPIPGPSAALAAVSVSGLLHPGWLFYGFLPARPAARRSALAALAETPWTLVFYEAPHRIAECVADLHAAFGERQLLLARELTKLHESVHRLPLSQATAWLAADEQRRMGEFALVVEGAPPRDDTLKAAEQLDQTLSVLLDYLPVSQAAQAAARLTGAKKNLCYQRALQLRGSPS